MKVAHLAGIRSRQEQHHHSKCLRLLLLESPGICFRSALDRSFLIAINVEPIPTKGAGDALTGRCSGRSCGIGASANPEVGIRPEKLHGYIRPFSWVIPCGSILSICRTAEKIENCFPKGGTQFMVYIRIRTITVCTSTNY